MKLVSSHVSRLIFCFAGGAILLVLSMSTHPIALAAWAAPVLLLQFVRNAKKRVALPLGFVTFACAYAFAWRNLIAPPVLFAAIGVVMFLPYAVDRIFYRRLPDSLSPLLFPSLWVLAEFATANAVGTWLSVVHSQYGNALLLQLVSLTGVFGMTFFIGLFAAVTNLVWERGWLSASRWVTAYALMMFLALSYGAVRIHNAASGSKLDVATITLRNYDTFKKLWAPLERGNALDASAATAARASSLDLQTRLLKASDAAAQHGARVIVWSEGSAMVLARDERDFLNRAAQLASRRHVYMLLSGGIITPGKPLLQNRAVLVAPDGKVLFNYEKSHPTPDEASVPGNGIAAFASTPIGNIVAAICYDYDFPSLLRSAAARNPALLLDPAWDSSQLDPFHTHMSAIYAIATGAPLVRATEDGLTAVYDRTGSPVGELADSTAPIHLMYAGITPSKEPTLYDRIGDFPVWFSLIAVLVLALIALFRRRRFEGARIHRPLGQL